VRSFKWPRYTQPLGLFSTVLYNAICTAMNPCQDTLQLLNGRGTVAWKWYGLLILPPWGWGTVSWNWY